MVRNLYSRAWVENAPWAGVASTLSTISDKKARTQDVTSICRSFWPRFHDILKNMTSDGAISSQEQRSTFPGAITQKTFINCYGGHLTLTKASAHGQSHLTNRVDYPSNRSQALRTSRPGPLPTPVARRSLLVGSERPSRHQHRHPMFLWSVRDPAFSQV